MVPAGNIGHAAVRVATGSSPALSGGNDAAADQADPRIARPRRLRCHGHPGLDLREANLAPGFFDQIIGKYEGTRLGRQELEAELLEDTPGALWSHSIIDAARQAAAPQLARIVVAIDPAVTSGEDADETGIIVVGKDHQVVVCN